MKPLIISIPHSGEKIPPEAMWLVDKPERVLLCDIDRFVDQLYQPVIDELKLTHILTEWHRYAVDLNRLETDFDRESVEGGGDAAKGFAGGLHWVRTTQGDVLLEKPMTMNVHNELVEKYFVPFHQKVLAAYQNLRDQGAREVFHIDAHSMPGMGTAKHADPGQLRADIVVSDCEGKSCSTEFKDLVIKAYGQAGFKVAYNWPYLGGRVTETYGRPNRGQQAIQVELNRSLYMDEKSKEWLTARAQDVRFRLGQAVRFIHRQLPDL